MAPNKTDNKPSTSKNMKNVFASPKLIKRDPSLPSSVPITSKELKQIVDTEEPAEPLRKRCLKYLYDRQKKTFCGRTCKSWLLIIVYTIMYLIFLATYTLIFLFGTLSIIKATTDFQDIDKTELLTYSKEGIGLTATPSSESNYPLIWYRNGEADEYMKYVKAIDNLLQTHRRKREVNNLGPCGQHPYGYGDKPCIIIRINKQFRWSGKPLELNSTKLKTAPSNVQKWTTQDKKKLWLQCDGYHSYDKEHIGSIQYFPDPPGFDPDVFPLDMDGVSPLVAIQLSRFTLGISLAIECQLWYEAGPSSVQFMVYVVPGESVVSNRTNVMDNL